MKDANAIIAQAKSIIMMMDGFVLALLLAGTVARAAKLGVHWFPSLDPQTMGWLGIAWWTMK